MRYRPKRRGRRRTTARKLQKRRNRKVNSYRTARGGIRM